MINNINNNNNSILLDTNSNTSNKKRKINCVICFPKVELVWVNPEENRMKCPRCKNDYQIGFGEIIPEEDILESSHEEYDEGAVLLSAEGNELDPKDKSDSGKIKRPKYMQDSPTTKVTYYREE